MSRDLDGQLDEMGEEYRAVVGRLKAAYAPAAGCRTRRPAHIRGFAHSLRGRGQSLTARQARVVGYLLAASLLLVLSLGIFLHPSHPSRPSQPSHPSQPSQPSQPSHEYSLAYSRTAEAIEEMIATQKPDGSWKNDFLTRQNAAALKACPAPAAQVAYKKALRNLRIRGAL